LPLIFGYRASLLLLAVAELRIADTLAEGPLTCSEIAARTGTQAGPVYRVLRALATYGVFEEIEDGRFRLTPPAQFLRADVPGSLRDLTLFTTSNWVQQAWGQLAHTMRTGETAFDHVHGAPLFEFLASHPDEEGVFSRAMAGRVSATEATIAENYDFSGAKVVVDVGGGHGALLGMLLTVHPHLHGVLFDLPHVVAGARTRIDSLGVADRCSFVDGDFFQTVPPGGDHYIMSRIIHDWNDERSAAILDQCRRAIPDDGKLLLIEAVIPPGNDPHPGKLTDMMMLLVPGGAERTELEYRDLFRRSGFQLTRVVPTGAGLSVIEAVPA